MIAVGLTVAIAVVIGLAIRDEVKHRWRGRGW